MKIIVISTTKYKEKDSIINAINENETFSFKVQSSLDPKSKNHWLATPFTIADVTFSENPNLKYPILKSADLLFSPLLFGNSYTKLVAINIMEEAINKLLPDEEKFSSFSLINNFVIRLKENEGDFLFEITVFLLHLLAISGYEFDVDSCICCGEKSSIVGFSFEEGGFVCKNCRSDVSTKPMTGIEMRLLRYCCKVSDFDQRPTSFIYEKEDISNVLKKLNEFISEHTGSPLNSLKMLLGL